MSILFVRNLAEQARMAARLAACAIGALALHTASMPHLAAQTPTRSSADTFVEIAKVLTHPRCLNCHPRDDRPRQGNATATRLHPMNVMRGPDGKGVAAQRCSTCHHDSNSATSGVPGAPHWHLAPLSMGWQGLATGELCRTLKDTTKNGNRTPEALIDHMETDPLVKWGWEPGGRRDAIPIAHSEFVQLLKFWVQTGAECPAR